MAWLRTLGPTQVDFSILSINFTHKDKSITLKDDPKSQPIHTIFHQLRHLIHTNAISSSHLMIMQPLDSPQSQNEPNFRH